MEDYQKFKSLIYKKTGIDLSLYKEKQMKRRIGSLAKRNNFNSFQEYYYAMSQNERLFNEFINYITINVSEFYRNPGQWDVLEKEIIPHLMSSKKNLKIWSAACSTGEEPYSMVMLLTRFLPLDHIKVFATDIDRGAIEKAKLGLYKEKSLENLPEDFKKRYFVKDGNFYRISDDVKKRVEFGYLNLLSDKFPDNCDLILCRNVLIYFTEEAKDSVYRKFYHSLNRNGVLFVGSTEQIILPQKYNMVPVKTFFYRKV